MELNEEELECIKFFPCDQEDFPFSLHVYFQSNLSRILKFTKGQLEYESKDKKLYHDILLNEKLKSIGQDFLVTDADRFLKFSVKFVNEVGYDIYINKDNSGANRLYFLNYPNNYIMISDLQTGYLLSMVNYEELKRKILTYLNLYKRFEIFWNSVNCFLSSAIIENGYWGDFIHDPKVDFESSKNNNGLFYVYGEEVEYRNDFYDSNVGKKVLIPFENFVPVLNEIIQDMKSKPNLGKFVFNK